MTRASRSLLGGLVLATAILLTACGADSDSGSEQPSTAEQLAVSGTFTAIRAADGFQVRVQSGPTGGAQVTADGLPQDQVVATIKKGVLELRTSTGTVPSGASLSAEVVAPTIRSITATSGADVQLADGLPLSGESTQVDLTAGASVTAEVSAREVEVTLQAGAEAQLSGSARQATVVGAESARLQGRELQVASASVDLSSGAFAELTVNGTLSATLSTGSQLSYAGRPKITKKSVSTGASLQRAD